MVIFISGTFNSGKTTLHNSMQRVIMFNRNELNKKLCFLIESFSGCDVSAGQDGAVFLKEGAREFATRGGDINEKVLLSTQKEFMKKVCSALPMGNDKLVVCDDSPFNILAYGRMFYGDSFFEEGARMFNAALNSSDGRIVYIFLPAIKPITDDGVRMTNEGDQDKIESFIKKGFMEFYKFRNVYLRDIDLGEPYLIDWQRSSNHSLDFGKKGLVAAVQWAGSTGRDINEVTEKVCKLLRGLL